MKDAWGNPLKMTDRIDIKLIIASKIEQVCRHAGTAVEISRKCRKTAGDPVPPHVDDFRLRQDKSDQTEKLPVRRHLVGEEGAIGASISAYGCQIALAQPSEFYCIERCPAGG